jgi:hypothetical protein
MDTSRLERFAKYARRYLMEQVQKKMTQVLAADSEDRRNNPKQVKALEEQIFLRSKSNGSMESEKNIRETLIEKAAYTWFNRFCALRYIDMKNFNKVKIVSPLEGRFQPEILEEAKAGHIDEKMVNAQARQRVYGLLSGKETHPDPQTEAFRILVRAACNYYADIMPFLFEKLEDWTELLMPDDLLSGRSILSYTREALTPGACQDVEVIGWLYQYYIAEKKDSVYGEIKKGKKVQPADIPAVTQLFTPHWIVRYMVQNSLGRLWLHNFPNSPVKQKMEFYIEDENPPNTFLKVTSPQEIRFCDPCCGSGHILTYAFDLLFEMYSDQGYSPADIPAYILAHNLYGIEIDERAAELAAFALTMKARSKDKHWFSKGIEPHICRLENIRFSDEELETYMNEYGRDIFSYRFETLLPQFEHADTFGSLIVPAETDFHQIKQRLAEKDFFGDVFLSPIHQKVMKLIHQAEYLLPNYQVVVTNPPYMGSNGMNSKLADFAKKEYSLSKSDLFAMFIERCLDLTIKDGLTAMITMQSWMFLSSYEKLRKQIISKNTIISMAHLGARAFDTIGGEVVSTTTMVMQKEYHPKYKGAFIRLVDGKSEDEKSMMFLEAIKNE